MSYVVAVVLKGGLSMQPKLLDSNHGTGNTNDNSEDCEYNSDDHWGTPI